ncbi:immunity 49 family protein [Motilimonas eburnea]|uniref:immunity 49 family protein n=1 Tax=Motilimonas eburnea TaxID=1737488 RepID=UPI001E3D312A|nr:immunity 49 family protein [Motilimonas eburnea]MCE2570703.1 immunity 49 family protein [Motilimonas eburnea]
MAVYPHHYFELMAKRGQQVDKTKKLNEMIEKWNQAYQSYSTQGSMLSSTMGIQMLLGYSQLLDAPQAMRQRALINLGQMYYNPICMAVHVGQPVTLTLEHKTYTGEAQSDDNTSFSTWLRAYAIAMILHDSERLAVLHRLDEGVFAKQSGVVGPHDFDCAMMRLLKGIFTQGADLAQLLGDTITYSAPEYFDDEYCANYAYQLYLPVAELLGVVLSTERETAYQGALIKALDAHKAWFTRSEMDHFDPEGWISLPITAIASYCYHRFGILPEVESDYIPLWMFKGECAPRSELPPLASFAAQLTGEAPLASAYTLADFFIRIDGLAANSPEEAKALDTLKKWAIREALLPPLCPILAREYDLEEGDKVIAGEVFMDRMGGDDKPFFIGIYPFDPVMLPDIESWPTKVSAILEQLLADLPDTVRISIDVKPVVDSIQPEQACVESGNAESNQAESSSANKASESRNMLDIINQVPLQNYRPRHFVMTNSFTFCCDEDEIQIKYNVLGYHEVWLNGVRQAKGFSLKSSVGDRFVANGNEYHVTIAMINSKSFNAGISIHKNRQIRMLYSTSLRARTMSTKQSLQARWVYLPVLAALFATLILLPVPKVLGLGICVLALMLAHYFDKRNLLDFEPAALEEHSDLVA